MTGKVLGRMLEMSGYKSNFLYYFGAMSQLQRNKSLEDFKEDSDKRILVSSIPCVRLLCPYLLIFTSGCIYAERRAVIELDSC